MGGGAAALTEEIYMNVKIAHTNASGEIQTIKEHLQGTAERARRFASEFGCGDAGYLCGLMHDIGKYSAEFQKRIRDPKNMGRVDHSTAGAMELRRMSEQYIPLAMAVAGHHSGLMDGGQGRLAQAQDGTFFGRLKSSLPEYGEWKKDMDIASLEVCVPTFCMAGPHRVFAMSFFIRMIYSCLVDADYLDTEAFMKQEISGREIYDSVLELMDKFENYIAPWVGRTVFDDQKQKQLCENRTKILKECMEKGEKLERGLYTLTVPTGGGKTTASLGFALKHIEKHKMRRIIYVIPYTSIIDQNAAIFTKILGEDNVLEHHSDVVYDMSENEIQNESAYRKILATENWDKPVVVTTAVQFFESLYACRSSTCRKLHNIANSVIIFDEAQTLPVKYLEPCVAAIAELVAHYDATAVLCTATQPALEKVFQEYLPDTGIKEICVSAKSMHEQFKRVCVKDIGTLSLPELVDKLEKREQFLCIVNQRKTAQELYANVEGEGRYCLTTLLYPAGRKVKIAEIRKRLAAGLPCRVIATSLVEAGVDLDFPEVFRQEAGLDSVIQAAGRCNREGKRETKDSIVSVFRLEDSCVGFLEQNICSYQWVQKKYEDVTSLDAIEYYFQFYRELLGRENLDQKEILRTLEKGIGGKCFPFETVAGEFQMIESETVPIYIPLGDGEKLIEELAAGRRSRDLFRKLGQYGVNVYRGHLKALQESGCLECLDKNVYVLRDETRYCEETGPRP